MSFETIIIIIVAMAIGYFVRVCIEVKKDKPTDQHFRLHCFQCEIDMPVVEKSDKPYCKNCGLIHKNNFTDE